MPYRKKLKKGDRVYYVHNTFGYTLGRNNPLFGSNYECEGTVRQIAGNSVSVKWDNGTYNSYTDTTLEPVDYMDQPGKGNIYNPNRAFLRKKVKRKNDRFIKDLPNAGYGPKKCKHCGTANDQTEYECRQCGETNRWISEDKSINFKQCSDCQLILAHIGANLGACPRCGNAQWSMVMRKYNPAVAGKSKDPRVKTWICRVCGEHKTWKATPTAPFDTWCNHCDDNTAWRTL